MCAVLENRSNASMWRQVVAAPDQRASRASVACIARDIDDGSQDPLPPRPATCPCAAGRTADEGARAASWPRATNDSTVSRTTEAPRPGPRVHGQVRAARFIAFHCHDAHGPRGRRAHGEQADARVQFPRRGPRRARPARWTRPGAAGTGSPGRTRAPAAGASLQMPPTARTPSWRPSPTVRRNHVRAILPRGAGSEIRPRVQRRPRPPAMPRAAAHLRSRRAARTWWPSRSSLSSMASTRSMPWAEARRRITVDQRIGRLVELTCERHAADSRACARGRRRSVHRARARAHACGKSPGSRPHRHCPCARSRRTHRAPPLVRRPAAADTMCPKAGRRTTGRQTRRGDRRGVVHLDDIGEGMPRGAPRPPGWVGSPGEIPPDEHHQAFDTRKGAPALDHSLDGDAVMCPRVHGLTPSPVVGPEPLAHAPSPWPWRWSRRGRHGGKRCGGRPRRSQRPSRAPHVATRISSSSSCASRSRARMRASPLSPRAVARSSAAACSTRVAVSRSRSSSSVVARVEVSRTQHAIEASRQRRPLSPSHGRCRWRLAPSSSGGRRPHPRHDATRRRAPTRRPRRTRRARNGRRGASWQAGRTRPSRAAQSRAAHPWPPPFRTQGPPRRGGGRRRGDTGAPRWRGSISPTVGRLSFTLHPLDLPPGRARGRHAARTSSMLRVTRVRCLPGATRRAGRTKRVPPRATRGGPPPRVLREVRMALRRGRAGAPHHRRPRPRPRSRCCAHPARMARRAQVHADPQHECRRIASGTTVASARMPASSARRHRAPASPRCRWAT